MMIVDAGERWVVVHVDDNDPVVRRYPVPGGWLYQISTQPARLCRAGGDGVLCLQDLLWHPSTFVPRPVVADTVDPSESGRSL